MMQKSINRIILILLALIPFLRVQADGVTDQKPTVTAKFSTDTILIGDQPTITVTVKKDVSQRVQFPDFEGKITDGVELIYQGEIDTVRVDGGREMELTRNYIVTIFDAGEYHLNGFPIISTDDGEKIDTILSEPLTITVNTYAIDTTTQKIYDIKAPIKAPITLAELKDFLIYGHLLLALIAIIVYIILRIRHKDSLFAKPKLPPHVIAVSELQKIKEMELWQQGKHKEYYTLLTDTLREYLDARFGKSAKEMTTDEIMQSIEGDVIVGNDKKMLYELLALSDLVKFAKYVPDRDDNESAFQRAFDFVEHTKGAEETPDVENPAVEVKEDAKADVLVEPKEEKEEK